MAPGRLPAGFEIRPIDAVLGAQALGVDLAQPLDDDLIAALYDAFLRCHLLVFRAQRFSDDWRRGDLGQPLLVAQRDRFRLDDGCSHHAPHNDGG